MDVYCVIYEDPRMGSGAYYEDVDVIAVFEDKAKAEALASTDTNYYVIESKIAKETTD